MVTRILQLPFLVLALAASSPGNFDSWVIAREHSAS